MNLRDELGQLSWTAKKYPPTKWRRQIEVIHTMQLPALPRRPRQAGSVWAITVVRDESDILPHTVQHLLDQGVEQVVVADNRSTDGTVEALSALPDFGTRIHVARDNHPAHFQSEKMTLLAHHAWRWGADWIVPFDADEFWFAKEGTLAEYLRTINAGIVHADFHHMVPTVANPSAETIRDTVFMMDGHPSFPGKVALRSHPIAHIIPGNHGAARVGGETDGLAIAHAQYRGPAQIARKVRQGAASSALTGEDLSWFSPHWVAGSLLSDVEIEDVFRKISRGEPDERIQYAAAGPMVEVRPLTWRTWDEQGDLAQADLR